MIKPRCSCNELDCINCTDRKSYQEHKSNHEIHTNDFNLEMCKKCGLPKERLTTHCVGMPWGYIEWHSIVDGVLDYVNGECIYKEIEDEA